MLRLAGADVDRTLGCELSRPRRLNQSLIWVTDFMSFNFFLWILLRCSTSLMWQDLFQYTMACTGSVAAGRSKLESQAYEY